MGDKLVRDVVDAYSLAIERSPLKSIKNWVKTKILKNTGDNKL